jgi:hypothetical protein
LKKSGYKLDLIIKIIIKRLEEMGIDPDKIPLCIEIIVYIIFLNPLMSYLELNRKMKLLGWHNFTIDEHTFKLVMLILDKSEAAPAHRNS